jgi:hypothetical protein
VTPQTRSAPQVGPAAERPAPRTCPIAASMPVSQPSRWPVVSVSATVPIPSDGFMILASRSVLPGGWPWRVPAQTEMCFPLDCGQRVRTNVHGAESHGRDIDVRDMRRLGNLWQRAVRRLRMPSPSMRIGKRISRSLCTMSTGTHTAAGTRGGSSAAVGRSVGGIRCIPVAGRAYPCHHLMPLGDRECRRFIRHDLAIDFCKEYDHSCSTSE